MPSHTPAERRKKRIRARRKVRIIKKITKVRKKR